MIEAAYVAGEDEVSLSAAGKPFLVNLASLHEIREDSGTAKPVQRKLTSQLQTDAESDDEKRKREEHLQLTYDLTRLILPVMLEVRYYLKWGSE